MLIKISSAILFILVVLLNPKAPVFAQGAEPLQPFRSDDRVMIFAPHPDDESIGCAGIIQEALKAGAKVRVVYLTNGDHNEVAFIVYEKRLTFRKGEFLYMGSVRRQEAINAMKLLGLKEDNLVFLGYPDFGTFTIFSKYWNTKKAFKNLFTRVNKVPYKNDYSYQAPYVGESILNDYKKVISDYKPTKIFVSHPADVNLDHKTNYLFLQIALQDLNKMIPPVKVYPYLIHCVGWPVPRHYHPELVLTPPKSFLSSQINWLNFNLSPEALEKKHKAILCYRSQTASSAFYLLAFARKNELFGDYPEIVLTKQVSLKDKAPEFFGFARLFNDSNVTESISQESLVEDRGQVSYAVVDNCLFIRIEKPKGLASKFSFMVYLFGYNQKVPFASMPKLRVIIHGRSYRFYDGNKRIVPQNIRVNIDSKELTLRIPLSVLGEPDFILTSLKAYSGKLPVDAIGFRRIVIK